MARVCTLRLGWGMCRRYGVMQKGLTTPRWQPEAERKLRVGMSCQERRWKATSEVEGVPDVEVVIPRDPRKGSFLKKAEVKEFLTVEEEAPTEGKGFEVLRLEEQILDGLTTAGFRAPTPIQLAAIPAVLNGEDCGLQSYTGSGKTLAYMLPILTKAIERAREEWVDASIHPRDKGQLQALIVAPSQELAMQIVRVAEMILPANAKKAVQQLIGGANIRRQVEALKMKPLIVVGTPGRLAELSRNGTLLSHKCPILVLDEVDQLTKVQFRQDMLRLTEHTGKKLEHRQTVVVSATLTPSVIDRIGTWAPNARFVFIGSQAAMQPSTVSPLPKTTSVPRWGWGNKWNETTSRSDHPTVIHASVSLPPNIRHGYVLVEDRLKIDSVRKAIYAMDAQRCLVFMNFARRTKDAVFKLSARGMPVSALHGDKSKLDRSNTLRQFRSGQLRTLVVSDIAARGIDVLDCDAVFNLELPTDAAHYAHRAGRTGRMGRDGWVLSFVAKRELFVVHKLAAALKIEIPQVEIRHGEVRLREKADMPGRT